MWQFSSSCKPICDLMNHFLQGTVDHPLFGIAITHFSQQVLLELFRDGIPTKFNFFNKKIDLKKLTNNVKIFKNFTYFLSEVC
ncbi:hypothetical protein Avbf_01954 [Armadillidium vulgare]|nr:hypothetical protein Avbf_01954 [Armadillidium vulgare]